MLDIVFRIRVSKKVNLPPLPQEYSPDLQAEAMPMSMARKETETERRMVVMRSDTGRFVCEIEVMCLADWRGDDGLGIQIWAR